jgi:hypothetical protein
MKGKFMKLMTSRNLAALGTVAILALSVMAAWNLWAKQSVNFQWSDGRESLKLVIRGEVHFTEDDQDVQSLSADGSLLIEQKTGTHRHRLEVRPSRQGGVERAYSRDGKAEPWERSGKSWLAKLLPQLIRDTALDAPARVNRIRRLKGEAGVLDEISLIRSDGAKRVYFQELFAGGAMPSEILKRAARQIGNEIHSDGDKAALLRKIAGNYLQDADLRPAFFQAERTIHSDGDRRSVLSSVLKENDPARATIKLAIESAATISSDGDKTKVLIEAIAVSGRNEALQIACLDAAGTIHSDGDHRRVLIALLKKPVVSEEAFLRTLQSAAAISSDGDKADVLITAAALPAENESVLNGFLDAVKTIRSDGDQTRVLSAVLERNDLSVDLVLKVHALARREIRSDGDRRRIEKLIDEKQPRTSQ